MSGFINPLRSVSRSIGSRGLHNANNLLFRGSIYTGFTKPTNPASNSEPPAVTPVVTSDPATHTPSAFSQRFDAAKYDKPPITPFANPELLAPSPLPVGTQLPPIADPLLDFTAALIQKHGERTKAARTVSLILEHIHILTGGALPLPIFREAVRLVSPSVEVVVQKRRAKNLLTPRPLTERKRTRGGILAILKASDKRPEKRIYERVARECINVLRGESDAIKKLEEVHRSAVANRANASIRI
ncbi:Ribosomal protein S5/S7 [Ceratobasidium theobromae]|uniref:Ribosomal protein S5/S7 n=1 Tax=Ceratobasidium theobromae TaxID=1582974 RepID=A0A5N5QCG3_9AGAM|nr:Ribosomal protein S5/S7 [Ceratobasidium theobromae]